MRHLAIMAAILTATGLTPAFAGALFAEPRLSFASDDFQVGGRVGGEFELRGVPVALFAEAEFRPYDRTVKIPLSPNLSYQLGETRQVVGLGATASYPLLSRLHAVAGAGLG